MMWSRSRGAGAFSLEPEPAKKVPAPAPEGNGLGWGANLIMLFHIRGVNRYISCRPLRIRYAPTRSQLADTGSTSPNISP